MELADGSLWDRLVESNRRGLLGIPRGELLGYLSGAASGIDYLNDRRHAVAGRDGVGVQHRDLKPSNILLFGGGVKVADLGMARAMEGDRTGHTGIWTYSYAPPEFFRGETARQSDQYSLAVTYCQLRGGRFPFAGSAATVTAGHLFGRPDLDALPEPERPAMTRALAKEPGDRWPNCRAFIDALLRITPDDVPDILPDPGGIPETPPVGWPSDWTSGTDPGLVECVPAPLADFTGSSFDSGGDAPPDAGRSNPTLVLPATPTGPEPEASALPTDRGDHPGPSRHRPRSGWSVAWVIAAALVLMPAVVQSPARPGPRPPGPGPGPAPALVFAQGIGTAAELDLGPADPTAPTPSGEPVAPPPRLPAETGSAAVAIGPMMAPPAPDSGPTATIPALLDPLPDPVLEGPIAMPVAGSEAADSLPGRAGLDADGDVEAADMPPPPPPPEASRATPPAVALASAVDRPAPGTGPGDSAFDRGQDLFRKAAYDRAIAAFDESLRLDPGHVEARFSRAVARHRLGDFRAAVDDFNEVIRVRPDAVSAYGRRGQALDDLADYSRAIADYGVVIRAQPGDANARFRRGVARYKSGDYPRAIGDFTETLRLDATNRQAFSLRDDALSRVDAVAPAGAPARPQTSLLPLPGPTSSRPVAPADVRKAGPRVAPALARPDAMTSPVATGSPPRPASSPPPNRRKAPVLRLLLRPFSRPK